MEYFLVTYDIKDTNRLQKIFKLMKNFGNHLQYSVFGCYLNGINLVKMRDKIMNLIDQKEDRVLLIRLCQTCKENIECIGAQHDYPSPEKTKIF